MDSSVALAIENDALDAELEALRALAREPIDGASFYLRVLEVLLGQLGATGGVLYASTAQGPKCVAQAGGTVFEGELDVTVSRYWTLRTLQADLSTGSTDSTDAESPATIPWTGTGHAGIFVRIDHVQEGTRVLQGVLVLDLGPSPRALRVELGSELSWLSAPSAREHGARARS